MILLSGGSGQIGTILARHLHAQGHDLLVLSRTPKPLADYALGRRDTRPMGIGTQIPIEPINSPSASFPTGPR